MISSTSRILSLRTTLKPPSALKKQSFAHANCGLIRRLRDARPDITSLPVRLWVVQPYSNYLIVYDPEKSPLQIIRILHAARDLPNILT